MDAKVGEYLIISGAWFIRILFDRKRRRMPYRSPNTTCGNYSDWISFLQIIYPITLINITQDNDFIFYFLT